jgi:tRNA-Thr(GGU) m(6)t(6)A37 methyltransferase TsaA
MRENSIQNNGLVNGGLKKKITFKPVGVIRTPHNDPSQTPIQPVFAKGIRGTVEIFPDYTDGLQDLEGFSHIYLIYYFDRIKQVKLKVWPYLENRERGVFATRSPQRPNTLGLSLVHLVGINGNVLEVEDIDILNGTPLLDIKPYVYRFDSRVHTRSGWLDRIPDKLAVLLGSRRRKRR